MINTTKTPRFWTVTGRLQHDDPHLPPGTKTYGFAGGAKLEQVYRYEQPESGVYSKKLCSINAQGLPSNGHCEAASISADGNVVSFVSKATNLAENTGEWTSAAYVHDCRTGETRCITHWPDGKPGGGAIWTQVSADGSHVLLWASGALDPDVTHSHGFGGKNRVYVHDVQSGTTKLASRGRIDGDWSWHNNSVSKRPPRATDTELHGVLSTTMEALRRSLHENWWHPEVHQAYQMLRYLRDTSANQVVRDQMPLSYMGADPNDDSIPVAISGNGRFVAFTSLAQNIVPAPADEPFKAQFADDTAFNKALTDELGRGRGGGRGDGAPVYVYDQQTDEVRRFPRTTPER